MRNNSLRIGVDTGGTFTDFVVYDPEAGSLETFKLPSTPQNPALAVNEGLKKILRDSSYSSFQVIHGSTVATNALLERKGAKTALVTTKGFRDVFAIGRQNRPDLYDLSPKLPPSIIKDAMRFEADERINSAGTVMTRLEADEIDRLIHDLGGIPDLESVAVCTLFSFLYPEHESALAERLREAGYFVSASHEILPEYREYERMATTVVNAYVSPALDRYLGELERIVREDFAAAGGSPLSIMQSNGGTISPVRARKEAVRCILSGPAGGLIAAEHLGGHESGTYRNLLTIDMGGTSTDVSLIADAPQITTEAEIGGLPIRVPVLDIHTIGAGGGSIAHLDAGGGLRVGPQSAGADPGPACYGRDPEQYLPTVTDANLLLGRIQQDHFLGGKMPLFPENALAAVEPLAHSLGLKPVETAAGIVEIANAHMARALRVISVARGHDPADFSLVSFGGAGGLHAVALARELGIPEVIVPKHASTFSAMGMLLADVVKDYTRTVMLPDDTAFENLKEQVAVMEAVAKNELLEEGLSENAITLFPQVDLRFKGQSYEIRIPLVENWRRDFLDKYRKQYGYAPDGDPIEIVNLRLQARGTVPLPEIAPLQMAGRASDHAKIGRTRAWTGAAMEWVPIFDGEVLRPGNRLSGPALVVRPDTTIWLEQENDAEVDAYENLVIRAGGAR